MSKILTLEEVKTLKKGDWVWNDHLSTYVMVNRVEEELAYFYVAVFGLEYMYIHTYTMDTYGTKWALYRNKEQEDVTTAIDYEMKYRALYQAITEICDKLEDKKYAADFCKITLGSKIQRIDELAAKIKAQLNTQRGGVQ